MSLWRHNPRFAPLIVAMLHLGDLPHPNESRPYLS